MSIFRYLFIGSVMALGLLAKVSSAHTYYQGLTDITVNKKENQIEIVHHFTTHDLENYLSDTSNQRIQADRSNYELLIKHYFAKAFQLAKLDQPITLEWVGMENGVNETVVYQVISGLHTLDGISIRNEVLMDYFPRQLNRVNYDDGELSGTLIFDGKAASQTIK